MNPVRNRVHKSKGKNMNKKSVENINNSRRNAQGTYAYYF